MALNAIQFDGSTQYGTVNNYTLLNGLTSYTLEGWFYQHDASNTFAVATSLALSDGTAHFYEMQRDNSGQAGINFSTIYSTTSADGFITSGPFTLDTWVYLAMVFNRDGAGVGSDAKTHLYYGSPLIEPSYNLQQTPSGTLQDSTNMLMYVAKDTSDTGAGLWNGNVGGFLRLWNYPRSVGQLATARGQTLISANEPGLIANFNFTEESGTTVANDVSGGNSISLTGSPTWVTGPTTTAKKYLSSNIGNKYRYMAVGDGMGRSEGAT